MSALDDARAKYGGGGQAALEAARAKYGAPAPASEPPPEPDEPGLLSKIGGRLRGAFNELGSHGGGLAGAIRAGGELFGGPGGGDAAERAALQSATLGFGDELAGGAAAAGNALLPPSLGGGRTLSDAGRAYTAERDRVRAGNAQSEQEHPVVSGVTGLATSIVMPSPATAIKAVGLGGKILRGLASVGEAAAVGLGTSDADLGTEEGRARAAHDVGKAAKYGAVATAVGLGAEAGARKLLRPAAEAVSDTARAILPPSQRAAGGPGPVERAYQHQVRDAISHNATPTEVKRAFSSPESLTTAMDLVEKTPDLKRAVNGKNQEMVAEIAGREADRLGAEARPLWKKIDSATGGVPVNVLEERLNAEIADIASNPARRNEMPRVKTLEGIRDDILKYSSGDTISHQDLRAVTTSLLKEKNQVVGAIAETPNYTFRHENHMLLHDALSSSLDAVATTHPDLAADVARLRNVNRDMSAALRIEGVAENALAGEARKAKPLGTRAAQAIGGAVTSGAVGYAVGGGPVALAATLGKLIAPAVARKMTESAVRAAGELARAIRAGKADPAAIERALAAGVPRSVIRGMTGIAAGKVADEATAEDAAPE